MSSNESRRIVNRRTMEHGTLVGAGESPTTGVVTAEILYDGDSRLTSVPLSEIEPERLPDERCATCGAVERSPLHAPDGNLTGGHDFTPCR